MLARAQIVCLLALLCALGCKKSASYDTSSPRATLASFEKAINEGNIPGDLTLLMMGDAELSSWQLRCKTRGCKKANFKVLREIETTEFSAVLEADVLVQGKLDGKVLGGKALPIRFEREGNRWFIKQIGESRVVPLQRPKGKVHDLPRDASTPDAGTDGADAG